MLGDWGKLIVAKGFKKLPKVQKIARSGHTALDSTLIPRGLKSCIKAKPIFKGGKSCSKKSFTLLFPGRNSYADRSDTFDVNERNGERSRTDGRIRIEFICGVARFNNIHVIIVCFNSFAHRHRLRRVVELKKVND